MVNETCAILYKAGGKFVILYFILHVFIIITFSIDASSSDHIGRFFNDSITKSNANCVAKNVMSPANNPNICFFASKVIYPGEELVYCYGETDKHMYWRLVSNCYLLW